MKRNNFSRYTEISSFEDFKSEVEILTLKKKLIETRLELRLSLIGELLSPANLLSSLLQELIPGGISDFVQGLIGKKETDDKI